TRCPASPSRRASVHAGSVLGSRPNASSCFGRPAVLFGQKRVPLPPAITTRWRSPAMSGARAAVAVLEPDDVVELRSGHLENVAVFERDHPMFVPDRDVVRLALLQADLLEVTLLVLEDEGHCPARDED